MERTYFSVLTTSAREGDLPIDNLRRISEDMFSWDEEFVFLVSNVTAKLTVTFLLAGKEFGTLSLPLMDFADEAEHSKIWNFSTPDGRTLKNKVLLKVQFLHSGTDLGGQIYMTSKNLVLKEVSLIDLLYVLRFNF